MAKKTIYIENPVSVKTLVANGTVGTAGQALVSNGSSTYWSNNPGYTGSVGPTGYTGSQGVIGYTGSQGPIGYTGSQGNIGYTGSQGVIGYTGSQGNIGYTGSQGVIGYTGSQGVIGYTGSWGGTAQANVDMNGYSINNANTINASTANIDFLNTFNGIYDQSGIQTDGTFVGYGLNTANNWGIAWKGATPIGATQGFINYDTTNGMRFYTGANTSVAKVTIDTSGKFGVGTGAPAGLLSVASGTASTYSSVPGNTGAWDNTHSVFGGANSTTGAAVAIGMTSAGGFISSLAPSTAWKDMYYNALWHYWYQGTGQLMYLTSGGNLYVNGDVRAPIFYDKDNTSYYIDPNSVSYLQNTYFGGASARLWIGDAGSVNYIESGNSAFTGNAPLYMTGWNGAKGSTLYLNFSTINTGSAANLYMRNQNDADILALYSSTFGYASSYKTLVVGNQAYTTVCIGVDPNSNVSGSFNGGGSGVEVMFKNGVSFITPNAANNGYHQVLQLSDGNGYFGNIGQAAGSLRAPIFYDTDNTSYYTNPASSSYIYEMTLANTIYSYGWFRSYGDTGWYNQSYAGGIYMIDTSWVRVYNNKGFLADNIIQSGASVRGPLFYDTDNTAYYADPASISNLSSVLIGDSGNGYAYGAAATGKLYFGSIGADAGTYYHITTNMENVGGNYSKLDFKWYTGVRFYAHYAYGGVRFKEITTGNTIFSVGEGDLRVRAYDSIAAPIYYDYDNTSYYVNPNGTSVFNGASFASDVTLPAYVGTNKFVSGTGDGASLSTYNFKLEGWYGMAFYNPTSGGAYPYTASGYVNFRDGWIEMAGSLRAPVFYDSNNTGYYFDGAGTSVMSDAVIGGRTMSTAMFYAGFTLDADTMPSNSTGFTYSVNAPYTGPIMRVSAGGGYDMWLNAPYSGGGALSYRTRNGDTGSMNAWKRLVVYDANPGAGDMYAAIYYDANNTAYYVDPSADSRLSGNLNLGSYSNIRFGGTSYAAGVVTLEGGYNDGFYIYPTGSTNGITFGIIGAYSYATNQFRAPIYYDSANTGYYIDANSDSNLYRLSTYLSPRDNNTNWNTAFTNTPAMSKAYHADISSGGPAGTWWFYESMRHSNSSNYWGTQIAWGWEDNANRLFQRNISNGSFGTWYEYLNTSDRTYNGNLYMTGSIRSTSSDMRAPIFYDQSDTAWFCDPNGTSKFSTVGIQTPPTASSYLNIGGYNAYGGGGYNGFMTIFNGWGSATNPYQYWRLNGAGGFEIVNSPYNAVLFTFTQGGDFTAAGNVTAYSDRKLKTDFLQIDNAIEKVLKLNGMTFTRIDKEDTTTRYAGLIAQDVVEVLPEAVQINETMSYGEVMSVDYNGTIALLVEAIKEQQAHINSLQEQINQIKGN